jgi:hypothetical protein
VSGVVISKGARAEESHGEQRPLPWSLTKGGRRSIEMELKNGVLKKARKSSKGQTFTEYSIVLLFVGVAAYSAYSGLGLGLKTFAENVVTFISTAVATL